VILKSTFFRDGSLMGTRPLFKTVTNMKDITGSVQRKLRWVENDVNISEGASEGGAGHSFFVLFGFHFGFTIFCFRSVLSTL
jgi:hypothetical protein